MGCVKGEVKHCQPDWIGLKREMLLWVCLRRCFQEDVTEEGGPTWNLRDTIPVWERIPNWTKGKQRGLREGLAGKELASKSEA